MEKEIGKEDYPREPSEAVRVATIRSVAFFFTAVLSAVIIAGCVLGAVIIYNQASCDDRELPSPRCDVTAQGESGIVPRDMIKETNWKMGDGPVKTQRYEYDHATNTLLIHTPASNASGASASTVVLDFDRSMFFVNIHHEDACFALPWPTQLAKDLERFLTEGEANETAVVDLVFDELTVAHYVREGEIPRGYLQGSSGTTVNALCAGRDSYWLQGSDHAPVTRHRRQKVVIIIIIICCGCRCGGMAV